MARPMTTWMLAKHMAPGIRRIMSDPRYWANVATAEATHREMTDDDLGYVRVTCTHCGNTFDRAPESCPGCAGREFR